MLQPPFDALQKFRPGILSPGLWGHMGKSAAFMLPCLLLLALSAQGSSCAPAFQAATAPLNAWSAAGRSLGLRGGQGQFSGCNPLAMTKVGSRIGQRLHIEGSSTMHAFLCDDQAMRTRESLLFSFARSTVASPPAHQARGSCPDPPPDPPGALAGSRPTPPASRRVLARRHLHRPPCHSHHPRNLKPGLI